MSGRHRADTKTESSSTDSRSVLIAVKVRPAERQLIARRARETGQTTSTYLWNLAMSDVNARTGRPGG